MKNLSEALNKTEEELTVVRAELEQKRQQLKIAIAPDDDEDCTDGNVRPLF